METLHHVTVLSNFARGYDKYARVYSKAGIPESSFPDLFFLLRRDELAIGVRKATGLLARLNLPGNRLIALRTRVPTESLHANLRTGLGRFIVSPEIAIDGVAFVDGDTRDLQLTPVAIEEATARSLQL